MHETISLLPGTFMCNEELFLGKTRHDFSIPLKEPYRVTAMSGAEA
jgi:hypothetical protein